MLNRKSSPRLSPLLADPSSALSNFLRNISDYRTQDFYKKLLVNKIDPLQLVMAKVHAQAPQICQKVKEVSMAAETLDNKPIKHALDSDRAINLSSIFGILPGLKPGDARTVLVAFDKGRHGDFSLRSISHTQINITLAYGLRDKQLRWYRQGRRYQAPQH